MIQSSWSRYEKSGTPSPEFIYGADLAGLQCLDTGEDFSVGGAEDDPEAARAFADTLLQLLASLTEPVIPASLHEKCAQIASRDEAFEVRCVPIAG